ncbi:hypothetical protein MTP04_38500 [Lysinibacillus sp. PLM2]|nr:hypothetical protein MTP04_38500 [Lysinibacillus sp. PLM2]
MIRSFLQTSFSQDGYINLTVLPQEEALKEMEENRIVAYIKLPKTFTDSMYQGAPLTVPIVGNSKRPSESNIVKELVESLTKYIESAQANILTVYDYARKTDMSDSDFQTYRYNAFIEFTLFTLAKDQLVKEEIITNIATSSPANYFALSGWFIAISIWFFGFYELLKREEHPAILQRLHLFGVTSWQYSISRIIVSMICSILLAMISFTLLIRMLDIPLYGIDYLRICQYVFLYGLLLVVGLTLIEIWIKSMKISLLLQILILLLVVITSGSIIPSIYLPMSIQPFLPFVFSNEVFSWMVDIVLEERNYAEFASLYTMVVIGLVVLWASTVVKKRWT